jgi:hypothetical protein
MRHFKCYWRMGFIIGCAVTFVGHLTTVQVLILN